MLEHNYNYGAVNVVRMIDYMFTFHCKGIATTLPLLLQKYQRSRDFSLILSITSMYQLFRSKNHLYTVCFYLLKVLQVYSHIQSNTIYYNKKYAALLSLYQNHCLALEFSVFFFTIPRVYNKIRSYFQCINLFFEGTKRSLCFCAVISLP